MYSQNNIEELFELIGKIPEQEYFRSKKYDFIKTRGSIWPNQLLNIEVHIDDLGEVLEEIENQGNVKTIPNLLMCNPIRDNALIIEKIKARNYQSSLWTAMSHNLTVIDQPDSKNKLTIKLIDKQNDLRKWLDIVEEELMGSKKLNYKLFESLLEEGNSYFFLGIQNDKPVATSFLFKGKSSAGIYLVSTLKTHRKKGIGKLMTLKCLEMAKELKCKKVDLQATDLGKKVYESTGFKDYGAIHVFRITPA